MFTARRVFIGSIVTAVLFAALSIGAVLWDAPSPQPASSSSQLGLFGQPLGGGFVPPTKMGSGTGGITGGGSGVANTIAKWTGASSLGLGSITDTGTGTTLNIDSNGALHAGDTSTSAIANGVDVLELGQTGTGQTVDAKSVIKLSNSGSYNTTSANLTEYGLKVSQTSTESAGGNVLTNTALYSTASGADVNYSLYTDSGDELFNFTSGSATFAGDVTLTSGSNHTLFVKDSIRPILNGSLNIYPNGTSSIYIGLSSGAYGLKWDGTTATLPAATTNLGDASGDAIAVVGTATFTPTATFTNGAKGVNGYGGTYFEWNDEWMNRSSPSTNVNVGSIWSCSSNGTGAACGSSDNSGDVGRPGIQSLSTGTTSTGRGGIFTSVAAIANQAGDVYTFEFVGGFPALSSGTDGYAAKIGFFDAITAVDQVDGCYFLYDERQTASAPATGARPTQGTHTLACVCAANSVRTEYPMDGSTVSDESFTTVTTTVAALTWPSTNVLRAKIVLTGTTRAEFYIGGTKRCDINTHLPSAVARAFGAGWDVIKSVGTTARGFDFDFTSLSYTLGTARS